MDVKRLITNAFEMWCFKKKLKIKRADRLWTDEILDKTRSKNFIEISYMSKTVRILRVSVSTITGMIVNEMRYRVRPQAGVDYMMQIIDGVGMRDL